MRVVIGTDHAGFSLKETVIQAVKDFGYEVIDVGTMDDKRVDFPDYAQKVALAIQLGEAERGIAICGSGVGVCIATNKFQGIYAALCHDTYTAHQGVEHDGMNVLCLGAKVIGVSLATDIVNSFLQSTPFTEPRYLRRIEKIKAIESANVKG